MARAHYADTLLGTSGTGVLSLLSGASVLVCNQGTTTLITATLHDADTAGSTLANPLTTDAYGLVEFWLDAAARVTLVITKTGYTSQTRTVDVEDAPGAGGSGGAFQSKETDLSSAAILALETTAVDLMGADPATGTTAVPVAAWLENVAGGTDYTTSANLWIGYANDPLGDGTVIQIPAAQLNSTTFPLYYTNQSAQQAFPLACKGQRLVLRATGPITGGTRTAKLTLIWAEA